MSWQFLSKLYNLVNSYRNEDVREVERFKVNFWIRVIVGKYDDTRRIKQFNIK